MHLGGLPPMMWQFADNSCGMLTIQCCQLPRTSGTEPAGKSSWNAVSCGAATVSKVNDVTMPKFPPPPPRNAQNRSGCADADTVRDMPSAVTSDCRGAVTAPTEKSCTVLKPAAGQWFVFVKGLATFTLDLSASTQ